MSSDRARRRIIKGIGALLAHFAIPSRAGATSRGRNNEVEYGQDTLAAGFRSRYTNNNNGVRMHVLEAGFESPAKPCVVFLHGFPELVEGSRGTSAPAAMSKDPWVCRAS